MTKRDRPYVKCTGCDRFVHATEADNVWRCPLCKKQFIKEK